MQELLEFHVAQAWHLYWTEYVWQILNLLLQYWFMIGIFIALFEIPRGKFPILKRYSFLFLIGSSFFIAYDVYDLNKTLSNPQFVRMNLPGVYDAYPDEIASVDGTFNKKDVQVELYALGRLEDSISYDFYQASLGITWIRLDYNFSYPVAITEVIDEGRVFEIRVAPEEDYQSFTEPMKIHSEDDRTNIWSTYDDYLEQKEQKGY